MGQLRERDQAAGISLEPPRAPWMDTWKDAGGAVDRPAPAAQGEADIPSAAALLQLGSQPIEPAGKRGVAAERAATLLLAMELEENDAPFHPDSFFEVTRGWSGMLSFPFMMSLLACCFLGCGAFVGLLVAFPDWDVSLYRPEPPKEKK